eukprot:s2386_g11.t1
MAFPAYALPSQASVWRAAAVPGTGLDAVKRTGTKDRLRHGRCAACRTSDTFDSVDCGFGGSAPRICSPTRTVQVLAPARCSSPVSSTISTPIVPVVPTSAGPTVQQPSRGSRSRYDDDADGGGDGRYQRRRAEHRCSK